MANESKSSIILKKHLNWTATQGHILTCGGRANELYTAERGFPWSDSELPHYHLQNGQTHEVFSAWKKTQPPAKLLTGVWDRPLFCGGWMNTTDHDEWVYNVQTHNLFVDLRIPKTRGLVLPRTLTSLDEMTPFQLRLYARQHVFAGFSVISQEKGQNLCTRHHCIDWNFVNQGRPRPNKWWVHLQDDKSQFKECAYATDENGQYYYFERWQRRPHDNAGVRLALRKAPGQGRDAIFVMVGDHFNYAMARELNGKEKDYDQTSLVTVVDAAVAAGDLAAAKNYLNIEAGHGTVSSGWTLDCAIPPWNEGKKRFFDRTSALHVVGESIEACQVIWKGEKWDVMDCSFGTPAALRNFLLNSIPSSTASEPARAPFRKSNL